METKLYRVVERSIYYVLGADENSAVKNTVEVDEMEFNPVLKYEGSIEETKELTDGEIEELGLTETVAEINET